MKSMKISRLVPLLLVMIALLSIMLAACTRDNSVVSISSSNTAMTNITPAPANDASADVQSDTEIIGAVSEDPEPESEPEPIQPESGSKIAEGLFETASDENGKYLVIVSIVPENVLGSRGRNEELLSKYNVLESDRRYVGKFGAFCIIYADEQLIRAIAEDNLVISIAAWNAEKAKAGREVDMAWEAKIAPDVFDSQIYENGKYLVMVVSGTLPNNGYASFNELLLYEHGVDMSDVLYLGKTTPDSVLYADRETIGSLAKDPAVSGIYVSADDKPASMDD